MREGRQKKEHPLHRAVGAGNFEETKRLIETSVNYFKSSYVNFQDSNGFTALIIASSRGDKEIVELLLQHGADASLQNVNDYTALMQATSSKEIKVVELLISQERDPHEKMQDIYNAAYIAQKEGHEEIELALLEGVLPIQNNILSGADKTEACDQSPPLPIPETQLLLVKNSAHDTQLKQDPTISISYLKILDILTDFVRFTKKPSINNGAIFAKDISFAICYSGYKEACLIPASISTFINSDSDLDWYIKLAKCLVYPMYDFGLGYYSVIPAHTLSIVKDLNHGHYLNAAFHLGIIGIGIGNPYLGMFYSAAEYSASNIYDTYVELSGKKSNVVGDEL